MKTIKNVTGISAHQNAREKDRSSRAGRTGFSGASAALLTALFLCTSAIAQTGAPTPNGLFYGDGDNARYPAEPFATSAGGSSLYLTLLNNTLYVALVVDRSVNDNVCAKTNGQGGQTGSAYVAEAGWSGGNIDCKRRMDSEFAEFTFTVGEGGNEQTFNWLQGYAGIPNTNGSHDRLSGAYVSDTTVAGGLGTPPPNMVSASSLMWNLNRYAELVNGTGANWTMPGTQTDAGSWQSPYLGADPNDGITPNQRKLPGDGSYPATGQPTFSTKYQWEWSMVYEWSVDMTQFGQTPVFVVTGSSHHSPAKTGGEDDIFPPGDPDPLSDFGDLPDLYNTLKGNNGAQHVIDTGSTLKLGANIDSELDGQPQGGLANADDSAAADDEDGVTFPASIGANFVYTTTITATNSGTSAAMLCGWFDFANDGTLDNTPNTSTQVANPTPATDDGERSCVSVPAGTSNGTFQVSWTIPASARDNTGLLPLRYRISRDSAMITASTRSPNGSYNSGEVEDYLVDFGPSTLPVSISSFDSRYTSEGLELTWATVSETHNLGFHVWGDKGNGLEQLNAEIIPAKEGDPASPRTYRLVVSDLTRGEVTDLAVTAIDYRGDEEVYGLFEAGAKYGQEVTPAPIPWQEVRNQAKVRGQMIAAERKREAMVRAQRGQVTQRPDYLELRVTEPGLQEITYEMLAGAGMNLNGVAAEDIAVTLKGEPVSRHVLDRNPRRAGSALRAAGEASERGLRFGPGSKIRFWGVAPTTADSIYVDHYIYRISVAPGAGRTAGKLDRRATDVATSHVNWLRQDVDTAYSFGSALEDPWYAARLRADRNNSYTTHFTVDNALHIDQPGRLKVLIAGVTDYPEAPDHRAQVEVNGQVVGESIFDGQTVRMLDVEVPAGLLTTGRNTVRVIAPGGTAAPYDLIFVDTVELGYPRDLTVTDGSVLVESAAPNAGLAISGLSPADAIAYGWDGERLHLLSPRRHSARAFSVATLDEPNASYWISSANQVLQPQVVGTANQAHLFNGGASDLLVIAHPAFMPVSGNETHPLNDYIDQRESEGWSVGLFDVTDIQAEFGHGMPLPGAVTAFLEAAERRFDYEHVLLVGGDSYDYTDNLGLGSVSFIPTRYAATNFIPHTPSDALLADLDGDGLSDKAVGRWPVRTAGDLEAIVAKTLEWPDIANPQSAIWVTDSEDADSGSFVAQAERMIAPLAEAGWDEGQLDRVFFSEVAQRPGASRADSARMDLFDQLEQGRALTGFVGHGAPSMWTFQGLLTPDDLKDLYNEGNPTLIGTMTCYTSYFVSPTGDTVAHRWMNGYRENAAGNRIEGVPNGAVAIHGAATLSNYNQNEAFAREVQTQQLAGETLGRATLLARELARTRSMEDLVINWTLLGDPTLRLQR